MQYVPFPCVSFQNPEATLLPYPETPGLIAGVVVLCNHQILDLTSKYTQPILQKTTATITTTSLHSTSHPRSIEEYTE
jgi:hypothetical protein